MAKSKLGSGKRFASGVSKVEKKEGVAAKEAKAIMATTGRKKYGATVMSDLAAKGMRRAKGKS